MIYYWGFAKETSKTEKSESVYEIKFKENKFCTNGKYNKNRRLSVLNESLMHIGRVRLEEL